MRTVPLSQADVGSPANTVQNEVTVAVSPTTGTILAGWNDIVFTGGPPSCASTFSISGWARSTNGGVSFDDRGALPCPLVGGGSPRLVIGDPALGVDAAGHFAYASLCIEGTLGNSSICTYASSDDGATFTNPSDIFLSPVDFNDKEYIAVDRGSSACAGSLYISWTQFNPVYVAIRLARRTYNVVANEWVPAGGAALIAIDLGLAGTFVQGSIPVVDPVDGSVYVVWAEQSFSSFGSRTIHMRKSTNCGVSFGPDVVVGTTPGVGSVQFPSCIDFSSFPFPCNPVRSFVVITSAAVGPDQHIHVVWNGGGLQAGDLSDVAYVNCTPAPACGSIVRINNTLPGRKDFQPWVTVATGVTAGGIVDIIWYSNRDGFSGVRPLVEVDEARCIVACTTTPTNLKVTNDGPEGPFVPAALGFGAYWGDYINVQANGNCIVKGWGDNRANPANALAGVPVVGTPDTGVEVRVEVSELVAGACPSGSIPDRGLLDVIPAAANSGEVKQPDLKVTATKISANPLRSGSVALFRVEGQGIASVSVQVFSLNGQTLYESGWTRNTELRWTLQDRQGRRVANGIYFYVISVRGEDGKLIRSEVRKLVLLR
ncbi:hypothetical protein HYR54_18060 [Candidatus Acetothermia bacterium]|nr:hypothetical protein [Candidatus Acetothermia bacterium]